jgi:glucose 1-dehydrogenase
VVANCVAWRDAAEEVVREIEGFGVRAYAHEGDVSQEDQVVDMVARMVKEFGTIDVMVANAGLQRDAPIAEMTVDQWRKVLDVDLTGQFLSGM